MSEATRLALKLQLVTAQRKGEILAAEWNEINLDIKLWIIPDTKAKNGIEHRVPLSALAIELITKLKKLPANRAGYFHQPLVNFTCVANLLTEPYAEVAKRFSNKPISNTSPLTICAEQQPHT